MNGNSNTPRSDIGGTPGNMPKPKPSLAIIGTEGSGKTVLTCILAKRLSTIDSRGVFLNPQGVGTLKYVEKVWQTLQHGDWPPSTPPGELFELRWKFEIIGEMESEVRLVDAAGQDLRLLFGEDRVANINSLPDSLRALAEYCRSADIVLFLVNLKDFIGEGNPQQRTENEAAMKGAMDHLSANKQSLRFCLILTQVDLYRDLATSRGGWYPLAKEAIPYIYAAYIKSKQIPVFLVSAVNKTRTAVHASGVPQRMPEPGFGSDGFDKVVDWMTNQVREVQAHLDEQPPYMEPATLSETIAPAQSPQWLEWVRKYYWIGLVILSLSILRSCFFSTPITPITPTPNTRPQPEVIELHSRDEAGFFDDSVTSYGVVRNNGVAGNVIVTSWVNENGRQADLQSQRFYLNAGESASFTIQLLGLYSVKNPHEVKTQVIVP